MRIVSSSISCHSFTSFYEAFNKPLICHCISLVVVESFKAYMLNVLELMARRKFALCIAWNWALHLNLQSCWTKLLKVNCGGFALDWLVYVLNCDNNLLKLRFLIQDMHRGKSWSMFRLTRILLSNCVMLKVILIKWLW